MEKSDSLISGKGRTISNRGTICEAHCLLYDMVFEALQDDEKQLRKITIQAEKCFQMGISLVNKLVKYNSDQETVKPLSDSRDKEVKRLRDLRNTMVENSHKGLLECWKEARNHEV